MSAYVVMIRERTVDSSEMEIYLQEAPLARVGRHVTPIARYGALEVLEGPDFEGCLIHRFQTIAEAKDWYDSSQYQEAMKHRLKGAEYRVFIIEGVESVG